MFFTTLGGGHLLEAIFTACFKSKVGENCTVSYVLFLGRRFGVEGAHIYLGRKIRCLGLVKYDLVESIYVGTTVQAYVINFAPMPLVHNFRIYISSLYYGVLTFFRVNT